MTRYADRPTVAVETTINAAPDVVWALVADPNLPARFSNEFLGAAWLDGADGPAVGGRFVGQNHHPLIGGWTTVSTVTHYEPERCIAWAVEDPDRPASSWAFELEPAGAATLLRQRATLQRNVEGVRALAEGF